MDSNETSPIGSKAYGVGTRTDVGLRRQRNEDFLSVNETKHGLLLIVCDGMGGHAGGERASRLAVQQFVEAFEAGVGDARTLFKHCVERANESVYQESVADQAKAGMGTTLVAALVRDGRATIVNVGDSRAYRWHDGRLEKISQDHSVVEELVASGRITVEQARAHPQRNLITRALGTTAHVEPDFYDALLGPGDAVLLASDGLHGMITDNVIADILRSHVRPDEACDALVQAALDAGGDDNVTVALVRSGEEAAIAAASATTDPGEVLPARPVRTTGSAWLWIMLALATAAAAWVMFVARPWEQAENLAPKSPSPPISVDTTISGLDSILLDSSAQATPFDQLRGDDSASGGSQIDTLPNGDTIAQLRTRDSIPRADVVTGRGRRN